MDASYGEGFEFWKNMENLSNVYFYFMELHPYHMITNQNLKLHKNK